MKKILNIFLVAILFIVASCSEDYLETSPTNKISDQDVFKTADGAQTVIDGVLRDMREYRSNHDQFGVKAIDLAIDLMGEDIAVGRFHWFGWDHRLENRNATYRRTNYIWRQFYRIIYNMNEVINKIDDATASDDKIKGNLKAQALTLRGYAYFQLVQLYQHTYKGHEEDAGVPVYTEFIIEGGPREKVKDVYTRITADLDEAITLFASNDKARRHISDPTAKVAKGIRARVALVMNDWAKAAQMASEARTGSSIMTPAEYSKGFDSHVEQNWMWGLEINDEQSTIYASWFSHMDLTIGGYAGLGYSPKYMSLALYNQMNDNDVRKSRIVNQGSGKLANLKFASGNGGKEFAADYVMMRPEEMLLIEAEAKARQGNDADAQALLKELRDNRYAVAEAVTATGQALLDEILLERRIELWGEGFRLLDIKRLKIALDRTGSNHTSSIAFNMQLPAESEKFLYKIPQDEIDSNNNITETDQNP
jgi:hypothetical protein